MEDKAINVPEEYPGKPITVIVPVTAGGSPDLAVRIMAKAAAKYLGQPLFVTNVPGGGATTGWNELAGSKPDGYTLGAIATGIILQTLYGPVKYHYPTALAPLAHIGSLPVVAAVLADQPWQNIDDLVKFAQEHPGALKFGHMGLGSPVHAVGEMFAKQAGIDIVQVPFDGGVEVVTSLAEGHTQLAFIDYSQVKDYVKNSKVRVLALAAEQRLTVPLFKDVPTFKEQGLDIVMDLWLGVGAPKGLPEVVKDKLAAGLEAIIHDADVVKNMADWGIMLEYLGPQEFTAKWLADNARLAKAVKETGIAERIVMQKNAAAGILVGGDR
ncbi:MAG TPA: tripartite tricarboxylate transporter substrate binding protein [Methylomusa anaerophila]|uniref:Tripartite tricarboxylate transporter family receptor n=1 Tax=Methylomusa anaerophila TaxID=1930071 RepID=A0A348AJH0_9FIRM|nr:tripartite tricarboxylate transporter substrate binding protein [Methylomusa anaerophila]BBB91218.1 tripartite tricarboxylate transporter family receptor [Methylomusa anaerophila]HML89787.1 tripartite tricarboxylate transporter substrate binding protein [Methylomusa anaerophila]